ncbi:hypothetical protein ACFLYO_10190 [Chloroflexota bacterium]
MSRQKIFDIAILQNQYASLQYGASNPNIINCIEAQIYSQNGEDGILLYIFSKIGVKNHQFVEFGIESGRECNTANLSLNFGWHGLLIEASAEDAKKAKNYYDSLLKDKKNQVKIVRAMVTPENINQLFAKHNIDPNLDLLSIDIDSNDYWVWDALTIIKPRLVVIEYNASLGPTKSISVKYQPNFDRYRFHKSGYYHGASLSALTHLAKSKGYALVGCDLHGINAFFVQQDLISNDLPELTPEESYFEHSIRIAAMSTDKQFDLIKHLPFDEIIVGSRKYLAKKD